jgi:hypothetical protein
MKTSIKSTLMIAVLAFASTAVMAQSAGSGSVADVNNRSSIVNDSHDSVQGSNLSNAVGMAYAPALATTLTETCMGSTSVGAGFSGGSFSFGTTWRDTACVRRLDARQVSAFMNLPVAMEMMCDSELVREAAIRAGRPCVEDGGVPYGVAVAAPVQIQVVPTEEAAAPVVTEQVRE